jgi:flagellar biosynthesis/type III secretory pathway M-ring protein FliF/YscJ
VGILVALLIFVLIAVVVLVVTAPLRRSSAADTRDARPMEDRERAEADDREHAEVLAQLTAARESKYQEIRDAELDFRTGKLSRGDYDAIDASLRAEAIDILDRLDAARAADDGSEL